MLNDNEHDDRYIDNDEVSKVNPADPDTIPKFADELPIPPVIFTKENIDGNPYYEICMEASKHYFHRLFPPTTIWGYNGLYPGPTIEVMKDQRIFVKWINHLPFKHFLPIDYTLHGAMDCPEVRTVVHVHGAHVDSHSDGHPDAWFTNNYALVGSTFKQPVYNYTNHQRAATLWYHDHSIGITRFNVYAGLAGLYIIRDPLEYKLNLPSGGYEIPLIIQDKSFNEDGSLFYPDAPASSAPVKPSVVPAFIGNTIVVNGKLWPHLKVEPRKYRFRLLNASNTRAYSFSLSNGQSFYQIGTDGGFLEIPVELTSIDLEPSERTDIIIDFSKLKDKSITLLNKDTNPNTNVVMEFKVELNLRHKDESVIPEVLRPIDKLQENLARKTRNMTLSASTDNYGRPMLMLNDLMWTDPATEKPALDSIEVWNLINLTQFSHPIHVHLIQFQILDRTPFNVQRYQSEGVIEYTGEPEEPKPYEKGWKDTVRAEAGMVTRIIMHFKEHAGDYVWHCHILEHEDHDMMRPLRVIKECIDTSE